MRPSGDDGNDMTPTPLLDDDTIDALVRGERGQSQIGHLEAFARRVVAAGEGPPPQPTPELARLLAEGGDPETGDPAGDRRRLVARIAGAGLLAKLALGATAAAATVTGAGVAGVLPDDANRAVRNAVEAVTPLHFDDEPAPATPAGDGRFGDRVSDDATGGSDGQPGVDGTDIADEAPGAEHRPDQQVAPGGTPDGAPGRPDDPGAPADTAPGRTPPVTTPTTPGTPTTPTTPGTPGNDREDGDDAPGAADPPATTAGAPTPAP